MSQTRVGSQRSSAGQARQSGTAPGGQPQITELKLPAHPDYIVVAKRAAGALATVVGFSLEAIDEVSIAITQACDNAIALANAQWGPGNGQLKLLFRTQGGKMDVDVRSLPPRALEAAIPQLVRRVRPQPEFDYESIGLNMIRLFVDELRYQIDNQTGSMRMRMVKYLIE